MKEQENIYSVVAVLSRLAMRMLTGGDELIMNVDPTELVLDGTVTVTQNEDEQRTWTVSFVEMGDAMDTYVKCAEVGTCDDIWDTAKIALITYVNVMAERVMDEIAAEMLQEMEED